MRGTKIPEKLEALVLAALNADPVWDAAKALSEAGIAEEAVRRRFEQLCVPFASVLKLTNYMRDIANGQKSPFRYG